MSESSPNQSSFWKSNNQQLRYRVRKRTDEKSHLSANTLYSWETCTTTAVDCPFLPSQSGASVIDFLNRKQSHKSWKWHSLLQADYDVER